MKKGIYYTLKAIILLGMTALLYFSSHFWIGTQEEWDEQVHKHFWDFFLSRISFTLIIGAIFFLFSMLLDWIFRKSILRNLKKAAMELLLIVILSLVSASIAILK